MLKITLKQYIRFKGLTDLTGQVTYEDDTVRYKGYRWKTNNTLIRTLGIKLETLYKRYAEGVNLAQLILNAKLPDTTDSLFQYSYDGCRVCLSKEEIVKELNNGESIHKLRDRLEHKSFRSPNILGITDPEILANELIGKARHLFTYEKHNPIFQYVTTDIEIARVGMLSYKETKELIGKCKKELFRKVIRSLSLTKQLLKCDREAAQLHIDNCTLTRQKVLVFKISWREEK